MKGQREGEKESFLDPQRLQPSKLFVSGIQTLFGGRMFKKRAPLINRLSWHIWNFSFLFIRFTWKFFSGESPAQASKMIERLELHYIKKVCESWNCSAQRRWGSSDISLRECIKRMEHKIMVTKWNILLSISTSGNIFSLWG